MFLRRRTVIFNQTLNPQLPPLPLALPLPHPLNRALKEFDLSHAADY